MPGICGIIATAPAPELTAGVQRMLQAMRHHRWYVQSDYADAGSGAALGRMTLGFVNAAEQPVWNAERTRLAVMDGELYQSAQVQSRLTQAGCRIHGQSHAELLLAGYQRFGLDFLRELHGSFAAAIWEPAVGELLLVNDRFGMRPLYYAQLPGRLLFASNIKALTVDPALSLAPSRRGLAEFFTFGHYLGESTSLDAVRVLPAAACFRYDRERERLEPQRYWRLAEAAVPVPERSDELLEQIDAAFQAAVDRRVAPGEQLGLSLSGGLDARTILALIDHDRTPVKTVCLGMAGSSDHRSAQQMARLVGCEHTSHVLDDGFLSDFRQHLERMVELTDGQYLSQCIVMPTLPLYRQLGIEVLLRGHAGELMHMQKAYSYSLDAEGLRIADPQQLEAWLYKHLRAYMLEAVDRPLFAPALQAELTDLARDSLRGCLAESAGIEPPLQRVWHLFVSQRLRREMTLSLAKIGSVAEVRVPYLDNQLVSLLLSAPPGIKLHETIQAYILRKRRPEFLDVANVNTGTRVGASRLRQRVAGLKSRVFAKLGVPGYQPYERLGLWLRRELAPLVREILLDEQCLSRGIFAPAGVRAVVDQHLAGRNHTFLLMAMLICELGQRSLSTTEVLTTDV